MNALVAILMETSFSLAGIMILSHVKLNPQWTILDVDLV